MNCENFTHFFQIQLIVILGHKFVCHRLVACHFPGLCWETIFAHASQMNTHDLLTNQRSVSSSMVMQISSHARLCGKKQKNASGSRIMTSCKPCMSFFVFLTHPFQVVASFLLFVLVLPKAISHSPFNTPSRDPSKIGFPTKSLF